MSTVTNPQPCWALRPEDEWEDVHYATRKKAQAALDEQNNDREPDEPRYDRQPEQLDACCSEVVCDGCGERLGEQEEGYTLHLSLPEVTDSLDAYEWVAVSEGKHFCPGDDCLDEAKSLTEAVLP